MKPHQFEGAGQECVHCGMEEHDFSITGSPCEERKPFVESRWYWVTELGLVAIGVRLLLWVIL